jgi:hypothetical protein
VLHAVLVARRVISGEWAGTLNAVRGWLCLVGVGYCSLKFWRVATIFDAAPRRALAFALLLLLGHWLLAPPARSETPFANSPYGVTAVLFVVPALGAGLALAVRAAARAPRRRRAAPSAHSYLFSEILPLAVSRRSFFLFRRPPPAFC